MWNDENQTEHEAPAMATEEQGKNHGFGTHQYQGHHCRGQQGNLPWGKSRTSTLGRKKQIRGKGQP